MVREDGSPKRGSPVPVGPKAAAPGEEELHRWFGFVTAGLDLAVEVEYVRAVVPPQAPFPVPASPRHVLGLISHVDEVVPVIDLHELLGLTRSAAEANEEDLHRCLIVFRAAGLDAAVLAPRAKGIIEVPSSSVGPPALLDGQRLRSFLLGEAQRPEGPLGILDLAAILEAAKVAE